MRATAEAVEGSKVRLSVQVDESEVDDALEQTVRKLSREVRVPGIPARQGAAPGARGPNGRMRASLRSEALREALPEFYARAVAETEVDPIAPPDIDITAGRGERRRSSSTPSSRCARPWPSRATPASR